jgi:hypothetical protein
MVLVLDNIVLPFITIIMHILIVYQNVNTGMTFIFIYFMSFDWC